MSLDRHTRPLRAAAIVAGLGLWSTGAAAQTVIVDNTDAGFSVLSGVWSTSSATGQWGTDYRYKNTSDSPAGLVEWRPTLATSARYTVYVWYRTTGSTRPNDAHYVVGHAGGTTDVYINQQINGSQWVSLGTYDFVAGTTGYVTLTSAAQAGKTIVADAVSFQVAQFRGVWVDAFSVGFKSTTQVNDLVARAVAGRYNAIVAEVMAYQDTTGSGHGAYWVSSIVPKATDISGLTDPLAYLVQQAHAAGLEVHAWLVPFRVCTTWPPSGNTTVAAHPEWTMVPQASMDAGPAKIDGKYFLDPGSPDVQEYLMSILRELVTNYAIDGVNWDYIRYVQTDAGYPADADYTKSSLARFQTITGYVGTPSPSESSWNDFRRRTIDEVVRRARAEIPSIVSNPRQPLRHSADLICSGNAPANFVNSDAYRLFQNWQMWMNKGWLDAGMPMNYKDETEYPTWYRNWVTAAINWRYDRHMFCGQGNYINTFANSITQLQYVYDQGADGSMNYSYAETNNEGQTWTNWYSYVATNLFTVAAPLPDMPWRDSATAEEGTLWGRVTDLDTGLPVDDATVQVTGQTAVVTDGNGYYVVTMIPASAAGTSYAVTASKAGYPTANRTTSVVAGDVHRLDIELGLVAGDFDGDGDVDGTDFLRLAFCLQGPATKYTSGATCLFWDADDDLDVDLADFGFFQTMFTGPP